MISVDRPSALLGILLIIPACAFVLLKFHRVVAALGGANPHDSRKSRDSRESRGLRPGARHDAARVLFRRVRRAFRARTALRAASWACACLAAAGFSWGVRNVPVQKSGAAVCMVFDISHSMDAVDAGGGASRLEAARQYARALLARMEGSAVSVVLAKGDGYLAIPLTEDFSSVESLIESLSPALMTAAGTSLGKGVDAAAASFPKGSPQSAFIWVFTDGDETDGRLLAALERCAGYGIPVSLVGFGSEYGADVLAGDGETTVKTFFMAEKLRGFAADVNKKAALLGRRGMGAADAAPAVQFVEAAQRGSARALLSGIEAAREGGTVSYEAHPVRRHTLFLSLAAAFLALSFVCGEGNADAVRRFVAPAAGAGRPDGANPAESTESARGGGNGAGTRADAHKSARNSGAAAVLVVLAALGASSCRSERRAILDGTWAYHNRNLRGATAQFFSTAARTGDGAARDYALFGLAATYIALEQYDDALEKLAAVSPACPAELQSAVLYNRGIICTYRNDFEGALDNFKKAALANPANQDAKINIELCHQQLAAAQSRSGETELRGVNESSEQSVLEKELFNVIKENDQNQWKKMESHDNGTDALDY